MINPIDQHPRALLHISPPRATHLRRALSHPDDTLTSPLLTSLLES